MTELNITETSLETSPEYRKRGDRNAPDQLCEKILNAASKGGGFLFIEVEDQSMRKSLSTRSHYIARRNGVSIVSRKLVWNDKLGLGVWVKGLSETLA